MLSARDRWHLHRIADALGIAHVSTGEIRDRQMHFARQWTDLPDPPAIISEEEASAIVRRQWEDAVTRNIKRDPSLMNDSYLDASPPTGPNWIKDWLKWHCFAFSLLSSYCALR